MHQLAAIKTSSSGKSEVDDGFDCREGGEAGEEAAVPATPSFAVSPSSFALLAADAAQGQTPRFAAASDVPATAESLPSDVLWRLATLLPAQDLPAMMSVCKSWRFGFGAAIDVLAPSSLSDDTNPPSAAFLARRFPCLRSLDLSSVPAVSATDAALVESLAALAGLTHLSLRGCRALTSRGLARALASLPRLRSLDLSGCVGLLSSCGGGFSAALPEGSLAGLEEFSADRISWLSDSDVEALSLALRPPSSCSAPSYPASSSAPRGLVKLSLDGAGKLTGKGLAALQGKIGLELSSLSLAGCASLDDDGLAVGLAPFSSSLTRLVLDRCPRVTGRGLAGAAPFPSSSFSALKYLSARDSGFDDAGADGAVSSSSGGGDDESRSCYSGCRFHVLEELVLDDCSALTDYGVEALSGRRRAAEAGTTSAEAEPEIVGLPSLAVLSLARLPRFEGWGLSSLLDSSPQLTSLCLAGCLRLTDAAAQAIGENSEIEVLDVSDCERVGVGFCSNLRNAPLVKLKASRCPRLSPAAILALGSSGRTAGTLEELEVSGCAALPDSAGGINAVGAALPRLVSLDLSATPLSLRGLEDLLLPHSVPSLAVLNLACCPRLSWPAVQRLLSSAREGGRRSGLRVNSWGCRKEEEEGAEKERRPSVVVENNSTSSPVLSFRHLSPQRGNRAAAAALAAAA